MNSLFSENLTVWSQETYIKAWNFASNAHKKQFLPGSEIPYINHIGLVVMEVMSAICYTSTIEQPNLAIVCALLHDTIEDTSVCFDEIHATFGEQIAQGVLALTKNTKLATKREQMLDSLTRIQQQPLEISMVKMADRITNLQQPPQHWTIEKITSYKEEAQIIHQALFSANDYLAQRLASKIQNYIKYC